ncbi:MAG: tRNA isopentenyl-2-thiomethyl-A-37 hydroxylase MiaE [Planctomycetaceae bacterium]
MLGLKGRTDPAWAVVALRDELALLRDHAHLERKAAGHVVTLIGQVPEAGPELLEVGREELEHFDRVCGLLRARGAELGADGGNPYVRRLARAGEATALDRVLRMGLIEARSYERFCLLAEAAAGDLRALYDGLKESEAGHHALFLRIAYDRWPREAVRERWDRLAKAEAAIVAATTWGPRIH